MKNIVQNYQFCFKKTMDILTSNEDVLAVFAFGSIINGDLWEKSDIDMFVVTVDATKNLTSFYSDFDGNYVHYKVISKKGFLGLKDLDIQGSLIHRLFLSSKLMLCRDKEIKEKYDRGRYYSDLNRRKWTIAYLSNLIKSVDSGEKAYKMGNLSSAYANAIQSMSLYSKVFLNSSGYMVSKDNISIASNFNKEFKEEFERLIAGTSMKRRIERNLSFLKEKIELLLPEVSDIILAFLNNKKEPVSAREAKSDEHFKDYPIDMEAIFEILSENSFIKKNHREVRTASGKLLIMENIYTY